MKKVNLIKSKSSKIIKLIKYLNCKNFGIYAAKCKVSDENYDEDRQLRLFPKRGALTDITGRT